MTGARYPSGKGEVCKTFIRGFDSHPRLQTLLKLDLIKLLKILGVFALIYAVVSAALFAVMLQPPDKFAGTMKYVPWPVFVVLPFKPLWKVARKGHYSTGEMAPDFSLESPDHKTQVALSSFRGQKPVVLVFGSYT